MKKLPTFFELRDALLELTDPVGTENVPLAECFGRISAEDTVAGENVPAFDRSAFDGYALRSADIEGACEESPCVLKVLEEVPCGSVPSVPVQTGCATKILTGAPIPEGADCVVMYERTSFTDKEVTIAAPVKFGENIIRTGEDVLAGTLLAPSGTMIDAGLAGTLAGQGVIDPLVYKIPRAALISTGSEIVEAGDALEPGKIYNTSRYTIDGIARKAGISVDYLGVAGDKIAEIAEKISVAAADYDIVMLTGGVSVGDYDLTPAAIELAGGTVLFRGVAMKPGKACAYGTINGKLVLGLSGNPGATIVHMHSIVMPVLRKLAGFKNYLPEEITLTLAEGYGKKSDADRVLFGSLDLADGSVRMHIPKAQGNVMVSSTISINCMAVIPAGSGKLEPGTKLKGMLI